MLPLSSPRLTLRRLIAADIEPFLAYRNDPEIARYQTWGSYSREQAESLVREHVHQNPGVPGQWYQIAIALKKSDVLVGDCALLVHSDDSRQATIGYSLARQHQGYGYATEALGCLLDHLFHHLQIHRVTADTDPRNEPSWRLLERLGMRREGHLRQSLWFKGAWADEYLYAIRCEEWLAKRE